MSPQLTLCYTVTMSDKLLARTVVSAVALLMTLVGCASMQEAEDRPGLTFLQVKATSDSYKGQTVVFGGKVLSARRQKDSTRIEVLQLPLDRSARPGNDLTQSQGRFLALQQEFLDPATLPPGTRVTVTGEVFGSVTLPLDEVDYSYPVINIKRVQVWAGSEYLPHVMHPYLGPSPYWGPYWGPYRRAWPYYW